MDEGRIPTNLRTLMILEAVGEAGDAMTSAEIGRVVGLPKQTIHRLCNALVDEGFLSRDESGRRLRPGRRTRGMASNLLHSSAPVIARRQILERVADAVGETVNFAAPGESGMTYIDRVETDWAFRIQLPIGTHVPFHATASGKTYLASLPPRERKKIVASMTLDRHTDRTHVAPEALLEEVTQIARQGYAIDDEELMEGMVALSVPVRNSSGRYVASLAFHGPVLRISKDSLLDHLELLLEASADLRELLF